MVALFWSSLADETGGPTDLDGPEGRGFGGQKNPILSRTRLALCKRAPKKLSPPSIAGLPWPSCRQTCDAIIAFGTAVGVSGVVGLMKVGCRIRTGGREQNGAGWKRAGHLG